MGEVEYDFLKKNNHNASITWQTKYVGEQYVDNTGNPASLFDAYSFTDLQLEYSLKWGKKREREVIFNLIVRNIFNSEYETNAWNYRFRSESYDPKPDDPYAVSEGNGFYHLRGFFPQAGTNVLAGLTLRL